jgi:NAD(P)H dehydrogenase (quinone)
MSCYAVLGITGQVGGAAANQLLAQGANIRAVVRTEANASRWRSRGVDLVVGDLRQVDKLKAAFQGTDGVFVMTPTWLDAPDMFAENAAALEALSQALRSVPPTKVVLLSSIGAQHSRGTGAILKLHAMERTFADLPSVTSIRAGWFMENFAGLIQHARTTGVLHSMLDPLERKVPMVATADIGAVVANTLGSDWSGQRIVELEGPRRYSPHDVAAALASVLDRNVEVQALPSSQWNTTYRSWGLSPRSAEAMSEMLEGFNSGWIAYESPEAQTAHGSTHLEAVFSQFIRQIAP